MQNTINVSIFVKNQPIMTTKESTIKSALLRQITNLVKQHPNDMELGKHVRIAINKAQEKLDKIKEENESA